MKKLSLSKLILPVLLLCLLAGCKGKAPEFKDPWGSALIITVNRDWLVVVLDKPAGTARMPMPRWVSFADEGLGKELRPGMTVELAGGGGGIQLSYPAKADVEHILVTDYDCGLISLYWEVLTELEGRAPELDEGTGSICIDLHNAYNLPMYAGDAITWSASLRFDREVRGGTLGRLNDDGLLTGPDLRWEDGVFLELKTEDVTENSFTLLCTKQRSREEKVSLTVKAEKSGGVWTWREE